MATPIAPELLRYERLAAELASLIERGVLAPGDRLPSVRRLASEKRLSMSTVVQALRRLEDAGKVEARPQSGYYVRLRGPQRAVPQLRNTPEEAMPVAISQRLERVLQAARQPGMAPLVAAWPAPELLPIAALNRLYAKVVRTHPTLLQSGSHHSPGETALLHQLVRRSLAWGGPLPTEELLVTNSCTEALGLCLRAVTQPGDTVAVESPAYYLMLQLLESLGLKALEIPCDARHGMSVEALDLASRQGKVAACLLVPNVSNPLGSTMPDEKKRALVALTAARGIAVIEDDIYGDLHFGDTRPWPLKAFDTTGNVMLCGSFSKSLSPALRLGFVAAGRYRQAVSLQKTICSGASNPVTQMVVAEYLDSGAYERHLRSLRRHYETQVAAMRDAVARHFPAETRISQPHGAFVLWLELPEAVNTSALYERAVREGVPFVPGELFSASGLYRNCLRLNCGNPHTPEIEDAVRRLGRLITHP